MQLNNTTQYAIRILSYIAKNGDSRLYPAKELSEKLNIPYKFLTKIMTELVNKSFVSSIKGRVGGYALAKKANEISVLDIIDIYIDPETRKKCILGMGLCDDSNKCGLHDKWVNPRDLINDMYKNTTLDTLEQRALKI